MKKKPTEAEAVKKVHKKPRGPNKKDNLGQPCKWNQDEGRWERDPGLQPEGWEVDPNDLTKWVDPNAAPKRKVGRPRTKPATDEVAASPAKKQKEGRRVVQPGWYKILPSLMLSACCQVEQAVTIVALDAFVCPHSSDGYTCPGCSDCSVLKCSKCCILNTPGKNGPNPFVEGTAKFHIDSIEGHRKYHPEFDSQQTDIKHGFGRQIEQQDDHVRRLITNALWCGVEHTALRKFSSLANLHRLNGLEGVSKLYCNHVMGRDFLARSPPLSATG